MFFVYCGVKIHYELKGKGKVCLFLHGWGQDGKAFSLIQSKLNGYAWLTVDLPPFGKSEEPKNWTIFTYANMVISLCEHLNIKTCNVIGHSFGGRIGLIMASLTPQFVNKLILLDSAGMKPKRNLKYHFSVLKYKIFKLLNILQENAGSSDYKALNPKCRSTFVSVVNTFLEEYCYQIKAPTLIVFGKQDEVTPLYMAKRLNRLIKNSTLKIVDHAGHFCYEDRPIKIAEIISCFLEEEK